MEEATLQIEALQWYSERSIEAWQDDAGEVYITVNGEDIYLAVSEVDYRGNLYLEERKNDINDKKKYEELKRLMYEINSLSNDTNWEK